MLHSGNLQAKTEYLKLIPIILSHSIDKGVFIEESRQLLSYSLIHPAITSDERSKFNMWLGHLDERFSNYHNPNQVQGQTTEGQGQCFSQNGDNGVSQRNHTTLTKAHSIGSGRLNGCWNVNNANIFNSSDSVNMNGFESQGQGHGDGNVYGSRQHVNHPSAGTTSGHMPLQPTRSAPANFTAVQPPPSNNSQSKYLLSDCENVMHQSFVTPGPHGALDSWGIAGLKCHVLTSASSPQCLGTVGLLVPAQTGWANFTCTCRGLSRALTIEMSLQCWAYTRALQTGKSISPLFPGPVGAVVTSD